MHIKADTFVSSLPSTGQSNVIVDALAVKDLEVTAKSQLELLSDAELIDLLRENSDIALINEAVRRFAESRGFAEARLRGRRMLLAFADELSANHINVALRGFSENRQVWDSTGMSDIMLSLLNQTSSLANGTESGWAEVYQTIIDQRIHEADKLRNKLKVRFPDLRSYDEDVDDADEDIDDEY